MIGNGKNHENLEYYNCKLELPKKGISVKIPSKSDISDFNDKLVDTENAKETVQMLANFKGDDNKNKNGFFVFSKYNREDGNRIMAIERTFSGFLVNIKDASYQYQNSPVKQVSLYIKDAINKEMYIVKLPFNRTNNNMFNRLLNVNFKETDGDGKVIPRYIKFTTYHNVDEDNDRDYGIALSVRLYEPKLNIDPLFDVNESVKPKYNREGKASDGDTIPVIIVKEKAGGKKFLDQESVYDHTEALFTRLITLGEYLDENVKFTDFGTVATSAPKMSEGDIVDNDIPDEEGDIFIPPTTENGDNNKSTQHTEDEGEDMDDFDPDDDLDIFND